MDQRLRRLEVTYGPPPNVGAYLAEDRAWGTRGLSWSCLQEALEQFAKLFAQQRFAAQSGRVSVWSDDWTQHTTREQRETLIRAEWSRLEALLAMDPTTALAKWTETAKNAGWRTPPGPTYTLDQSGFEDLLSRFRSGKDAARAGDSVQAAAWRWAHPDWAPEMPNDAFFDFEARLMCEGMEPSNAA